MVGLVSSPDKDAGGGCHLILIRVVVIIRVMFIEAVVCGDHSGSNHSFEMVLRTLGRSMLSVSD